MLSTNPSGPAVPQWCRSASEQMRVNTMPQPTDPARDLLFGLLALQNGLIDQGGSEARA